MRRALALVTIAAVPLLFASTPLLASEPSLEVSQYAHTSWTVRDGFSLGAVFAMAQTPDGYLWLGNGSGLFYFDGVRFVRWQSPAGEQRPIAGVYSLLCARDGTLWIGTFEGLASWRDGRLTWFHEFDKMFVTSMLEDHNRTVWIGTLTRDGGRLCTVQSGRGTCSGDDGRFGAFVWSLHEDHTGTLWVGADSGVWKWAPGSPRRYPTPGVRVGDLSASEDGQLLIGIRGKRLRHLIGEKVDVYPIRRTVAPTALLQDDDVDSNKLLRDSKGALWIGTEQRGLVHVQRGRADTFAKSDGLSGDIICSLFEDREGNIWVSTSAGLDRFRELPVRSYSRKQGLSSDKIASVVAATDGSLWLAAPVGLTRWKDGQTTIFRRTSGLPDDSAQSLFEDPRGRIWVFTKGGLAYSDGSRFVAVPGVPSDEVFSITGDEAGNLWLSGNRGLTHLRSARIVEHFPWSTVRRTQQAKVVLSDKGGVWLSFWNDGGVEYFKDGQLRASFGVADGLGKGVVPGIQLDEDGTLWAATASGISRIKDGHVATLTSANGLPCETIHATMWDDSGALWAYCRVRAVSHRPERARDVDRKPDAPDRDHVLGCRRRCAAPDCTEQLWSLRRQGVRWEAVVCRYGRHPGRRSASPFVQRGPTAGPCRAFDRRSRHSIAASTGGRRGTDCSPAAGRPRCADRLHGSQFRRAGKSSFQVPARRPRQ